jgi:4-amino-4-deoxy-L-arabinose transferase-like glycosyltransferase
VAPLFDWREKAGYHSGVPAVSVEPDVEQLFPPPLSARRLEWLLPAAVLLLAATLRLAWPGLTEFKADEARLLALSLDMAAGERFAWRGISSSVGFPNFPMSVWLYTLPLLFWPHVYAATLFTGLLNSLAVLACYWFTRRYWGREAALVAALLFAVSPWAVIFSRKIWAQNLLPLFVMGWIIGGCLAFVERRPAFVVLHLLCLAVAVQVHLAAVALVPVTLCLLLLFRRRLCWRWFLAGSSLAVATAVPFALYLWQQGLSPADAWSAGALGSRSFDPASFRLLWLLSLGGEIHSLAGPAAYREFLALAPGTRWAQAFWSLLIGGGVVYLLWQVRGQRGRPAAEAGLLVALWLLAVPLFFLYQSTAVYIHYLIATLPAPYVAAGVFWAALLKRRGQAAGAGQIVAGGSWAVPAATAVAQVAATVFLLNFVAGRATPGGFGPPLQIHLEAARQVAQMVASQTAAEALVAGSSESPAHDEFAAVYAVLLRATPHRFVDATRSALFPVAPAVVLLQPDIEGAVDLYLAAAASRIEIPLRPGEGSLQLLTLPGQAAPSPTLHFEPPQLLANWVTLLGYDVAPAPAGDAMVWRLHWRTGMPASVDYHFFNHLLDSEGQRLSQDDAASFSARQWREGDVVVSHFSLPWSGNATRGNATQSLAVRSGMYTYPAVENVPFLDVAANAYSDHITILLAGD